MRLKHLFTVPEGEKVTERHFRRVLISSVCGMLICMSCLVGTTWALYESEVESSFSITVDQYPAQPVQEASVPEESDESVPGESVPDAQ